MGFLPCKRATALDADDLKTNRRGKRMTNKPFDDMPTQRPGMQNTGEDNDPFAAKTVRVGDMSRGTSAGGENATRSDTNKGKAPSDFDGGGKTVAYRPGKSAPHEGGSSTSGNTGAEDANVPVVGWLVILKGPGAGNAVSLGYGLNSVGRGTDQRVSLNFGDEKISRGIQFSIAYDPKGRKFFVQNGSAQNLTYLNGSPVLAPLEVEADAVIEVGDTTLRFLPLCGENFDWEDLDTADGS